MKIWNFVFCFLLMVGFTLNAKAERKYNSFGFPIGGSTCELALEDDLSGTAEELFQQAQDALKNEKFCEASRILFDSSAVSLVGSKSSNGVFINRRFT